MTMPATPISSVMGTAGTPPVPPARPDSLGKDAFLKLLVAQLRYQDPTKPTDSSTFMSQTAQFTQVEKLDEIAKSTTAMLAAQSMSAVGSLVGRTVTYTGPDGRSVSGPVTSVGFSAAGPMLRVGQQGVEIPVGAVTEIRSS